MVKKQIPLTTKQLEKILDQQTKVILNAVDTRLQKTDLRIGLLEQRVEAVNVRLGKMEARINQKLDKLTTTLHKFLKRLTNLEDEFEIMKHDLNRLKKVVREKLGVDLS